MFDSLFFFFLSPSQDLNLSVLRFINDSNETRFISGLLISSGSHEKTRFKLLFPPLSLLPFFFSLHFTSSQMQMRRRGRCVFSLVRSEVAVSSLVGVKVICPAERIFIIFSFFPAGLLALELIHLWLISRPLGVASAGIPIREKIPT